MAAESIQDIKRRIKSVSGTERITNSMKLVSAGKLRRARKLFEETHENSRYITNTISELFNSSDDVPRKYLDGNSNAERTAYIVVTSSKGLCGGFNTNVIKRAHAEINSERVEPLIVAIGGKGQEYFQKRGYKIHSSYLRSPEGITFLEAQEITKPLVEMYDRGEIDKIVIVYTEFVNSMEQSVTTQTLLPFTISEDVQETAATKKTEYEPSVDVVFNYLIPKYVEMEMYSSIIESATCEHAARRMAMENATDNAREMLDKLNLTYNRARQTAITNEIIEIVAGSEAQN